ncbi:alpha-D-ribose 1-methylphosphonate 5-triphosphate diphosphatase [Undibacter mobilis]|uniref:Alpha-D-ribose 1-methylphosphonate 5-triphosphate diphosphatase n=1 Tax=Undibacter mobilis TaxID=2292256 RepID=A0A371B9U7_9BRAD|nr:alpha-D-ribose 1-methylphosphonate 5-triphosphate diphosphatase [Undibacter mobilis]RDV04312.1 alpha-D-ribose 1-methylphosphonate 5-triphosphate diphosphatase [Undibacter mobilis]
MPDTTIIENARIVLADKVIERGYVAFDNGQIAEIGDGKAPERGIDAEGDLLLPGLVELHTDHLEAHVQPRPKVQWNAVSAVVSYDAQIATSGITTVLDSLRVWREEGNAEGVDGQAALLSRAIDTARAAGLLRVDHYLHLRCEVPMPQVVIDTAELIGRPDVRLISLMDHTPGQRQFQDPQKLREYYRGKSGGMSEAELDEMFARRIAHSEKYAPDNYKGLVELAHRHDTPIASHDDTTAAHVDQAIKDRVAIAEFPTNVPSAQGLHANGIKVMMGAPNLVRGGSHSGNVATAELARAGLLDLMSSDYVPSSLLLAALMLPQQASNYDLPAAIRTVSKTPAEAVGLDDRGEIATGKRADVIRVHVAPEGAAVRSVWSAGRRVA